MNLLVQLFEGSGAQLCTLESGGLAESSIQFLEDYGIMRGNRLGLQMPVCSAIVSVSAQRFIHIRDLLRLLPKLDPDEAFTPSLVVSWCTRSSSRGYIKTFTGFELRCLYPLSTDLLLSYFRFYVAVHFVKKFQYSEFLI